MCAYTFLPIGEYTTIDWLNQISYMEINLLVHDQ